MFDPITGDLSQIAVRKEFRRKGIATQLLREATVQMLSDFVKVLNIPSDNITLNQFLKSKNIAMANRQFEMSLPL